MNRGCAGRSIRPHPRPAPVSAPSSSSWSTDYSRLLLLHGRWVADQNTRAGQDVLRAAIQRRELSERQHVDNGAPNANTAIERSFAVLGIRLTHSRSYSLRT